MVPIDEDDNEHKKVQLRKLAEINGTLKKQVFEPIQRTWASADVYCKHCGEISHATMDCPLKNKQVRCPFFVISQVCVWVTSFPHQVNQKEIDTEYMSFMAEIGLSGESAPAAGGGNNANKDYDDFMASVLGGSSKPQPTQQPTQQQPQQQQQQQQYAPPQQYQQQQGNLPFFSMSLFLCDYSSTDVI